MISVRVMDFQRLANPERSIRMGDFLSKLRSKPITPLEETKIVAMIPKDNKSRLFVSMKSTIIPFADSYNLGLGANK